MAGPELRESDDNPRQWQASLKPLAGLPFDIKITQLDSATLSVEVRDKTVRFAKAPPPVDPAPAPQSLTFLGAFANAECVRAHAKVRQVWLWEDGQLDHTELTFSELDKIASAFMWVLTNVYHHRIDYPGFDFNRRQDRREPGAVQVGTKTVAADG